MLIDFKPITFFSPCFTANKYLASSQQRTSVTTNLVNMTYAHHESPSSSVVRASDWCTEGDMGSIPVGDSDFFFVPRSRHAEYSIFSYFFSELKIHHLSLFINAAFVMFLSFQSFQLQKQSGKESTQTNFPNLSLSQMSWTFAK